MKKYNFNLIPFKRLNDSFDIQASLELIGSNVEVEFSLKGDIKDIYLPSPSQEKRRVIGLWESSCFELFIHNKNTTTYYEFNFSSEGHWNCFYFPTPKTPLKQSPNFEEIDCATSLKDQSFTLKAVVNLYNFHPGFWEKESMSFGLSSVIEKHKSLSYWAISHCDEKPNFHNVESFEKIILE
jgi:hypothetical protein